MKITSHIMGTNPMVHCASVCPYRYGVLVAYYIGPECSDDQRVCIRYISDDAPNYKHELYRKTGNSIIWSLDNNTAGLIYSHFNDTDGTRLPTRRVHRWIYCSNWQTRVEVTANGIKTEGLSALSTFPPIGFLVRCTPIKVENEWILPMYREDRCYGMIMKSEDGWNWRTAGTIGMFGKEGQIGPGVCIQPTVWWDGRRLHSLSRSTRHKLAWYSVSDDLGETWSQVTPSEIDNDNNSLVVINTGKPEPWLIWNLGAGRSNLVLGRLNRDNNSAVPYLLLNKGARGSYPNYCFDTFGKLHIVHTDGGRIAHHSFSTDALEKLEPAKKSIPSIYELGEVEGTSR